MIHISGKQDLRISFQHLKSDASQSCICTVEKGPFINDQAGREGPGIHIATASATCHLGDNYCKNTGRKISMTRALRACGFDKTKRRQIWTVYFATRNGKK